MKNMRQIRTLGIGIGLLLAGTTVAQAQTETEIINSASGSAVGFFSTNIGADTDHSPPYAPGIISAPIASPTLFTTQGIPAYVKNLPIILSNLFDVEKNDFSFGCSRATQITYNSVDVPKRPELKGRKIQYSFYGVADGEIVGSLTIQSRKNAAEEVDIPTLVYDATRYINERQDLKGYNITLLSHPQTLTYMLGVDTRANGVSVSPFFAGFPNGNAGAEIGVVPSVSKSGGVTMPTAVIGCTFLVLVDGPQSQHVDIRQIRMPDAVSQPQDGRVSGGELPGEQAPQPGNNSRKKEIRKKKFEAQELNQAK